jgi:outer membrane protein TolC
MTLRSRTGGLSSMIQFSLHSKNARRSRISTSAPRYRALSRRAPIAFPPAALPAKRHRHGKRIGKSRQFAFRRAGSHSNSAEIDASWEPDFFGSVRKNVAAYDADIQTAQENLRNTMVSLTAEVALDYVNLRSYQSQIAVTQSNLAKYRETYEMTVAKRESGLSTDLDVAQALETVQSTEATIPTLEINLQQMKNALAILLAQRPGSLDSELSEVKPIPSSRPRSPWASPETLSAGVLT